MAGPEKGRPFFVGQRVRERRKRTYRRGPEKAEKNLRLTTEDTEEP